MTENKRTIDVYYASDPMCSHCWGLEPELNKFLAEYGHYFKFHTIMGGNVYDWHSFEGDKWNHIYDPKDTTDHWREVGEKSGMPIDGSVMQVDPVTSSFPASQVVKLLQEKSNSLALTFLRKVREALFIHNQNISDKKVLINLVDSVDENGEDIVSRALTPTYEEKVLEDKKLMRSLGPKVTPAVVFVNEKSRKTPMVGMNSANRLANGLKRSLGVKELEKQPVDSLPEWLEHKELIFAKEIEVMYELEAHEVKAYIERTLEPDAFEFIEFQHTFYIKKI